MSEDAIAWRGGGGIRPAGTERSRQPSSRFPFLMRRISSPHEPEGISRVTPLTFFESLTSTNDPRTLISTHPPWSALVLPFRHVVAGYRSGPAGIQRPSVRRAPR